MRRGFTLLELVVALAVIGVSFAVALPALQSPATSDPLDAAVSKTLDLLRSSRREALRRGESVVVTIDPAGRLYWVMDGQGGLVASGRLGLAAGVTLQTREPRARVVFRADGTASSDALALAWDGRAVTVSADPWTGALHASR